MPKTFKQVADNTVKYFNKVLSDMKRDFPINDKPIEDMTDAEYAEWLKEAEKAELQYQTAMDKLFEAWFDRKYSEQGVKQ